jgi:hypothetical protein
LSTSARDNAVQVRMAQLLPPSVQNYHSHLYFLVLPNCCSVSQVASNKVSYTILADV